MLIKTNGASTGVAVAKLEFTKDVRPEEAGNGSHFHYRGVPGWVSFLGTDGKYLGVNSRCVMEVAADPAAGGEATIIESDKGESHTVQGTYLWVMGVLNAAERAVPR